MRPGDYPDGAFVWHDVEYVMRAIEDDSFGQTPAEHVQMTPNTEFPGEGMIEDGGSFGLAFLTVRAYPFPEDGSESPAEQTIYVDRQQAEQLRDWLDARLMASERSK